MNGILAVDKPRGLTSHDVVARIRRIAGQRQVGHAGTLDPIATGVLITCIGDATRLSEQLMSADKWYLARVVFGFATETHDCDGREVSTADAPVIGVPEVRAALAEFLGGQPQIPPSYAAIKRDGVPAYVRARRGETVEMEARTVTLRSLAVIDAGQRQVQFRSAVPPLNVRAQTADVLVCCSKGTYIRALARDLGDALGTRACMGALRRLASGRFTALDCFSLESVEGLPADEARAALSARLQPMDAALATVPAAVLGADHIQRVGHGSETQVAARFEAPMVRLYRSDGALAALAGCDMAGAGAGSAPPLSRLRPYRVFHHGDQD